MNRTKTSILALALPLILALPPLLEPAQIQSPPVSKPEIIKLSSTLWSDLRDIKFHQSRAYCLFYDGLTITDLANINSPSQIGQVELPKDGLKVDLWGNHAYAVSAESLMHVIDISSLSQPSLISSFKTPDLPRDIKVGNNCAYVAAKDAGLLVLNISDPLNVSLIGSCYVAGFHPLSLDLRDNVAYISGTGGLKLVHVLFPYFPYLIGSSDVVPGANKVFVNTKGGRTYAYLGNPAQFSILDVSSPRNVVLVSSHATTSTIADISVVGDYAFLGSNCEGLLVLDITDRTSPQEVSALSLGHYSRGVYFYSDFVFVADLFDPVSIINVFNPDRPFVSGRWIMPGTCKDIAVKDGFAYVMCDHSGLHILNVEDPHNPQAASVLYAPYNNNGVEIEGDYAYITALLTGMQVVDASDPYHPVVVGSYVPQGYTYGLEVKGGYAYLLNAENDIQIIDVQNPSGLIPRGSVETPGTARELVPMGDYLYVADQTAGLTIINALDKDNPFLVTSIPTSGECTNVFSAGDLLFASCNSVGMEIYDIYNPEAPESLGFYPISEEIEDLFVEHPYAYLSMGNEKVQVVDISSSPPLLVACYNLLDRPGSLVADDKHVYLCDNRSFKILRFLPYRWLPRAKAKKI